MTKIDPYQRWLGIPPQDRPLNRYRLLGLELFEQNPDVIKSSAENAIAYIQQNAFGEELQQSQQLIKELSAVCNSLLDPKQKARYDKKLKIKLGLSVPVEVSAEQQRIKEGEQSESNQPNRQKSSKQKRTKKTTPTAQIDSSPIQVSSSPVTDSIQSQQNQSQLNLSGFKISYRTAALSGAGLFALIIMFSLFFMGGEDKTSPQHQVAEARQAADSEVIQIQSPQASGKQQKSPAKDKRPAVQKVAAPKKPVKLPPKPKAPLPQPDEEFIGQFTVRADSIKKGKGKQLKDVTVEVIYQPGRKKNERVLLGTFKTDEKGSGKLQVKLLPKEQTGRFLVKLTRSNESWERKLVNFPNELSHTLTIPVVPEPEYLNPQWIEQRLAEVGIDDLIEEYRKVKDPRVQTVYSALTLSRQIIDEHPEALLEQLQMRLLSHKEVDFTAFQLLTDQRIHIRTVWPTLHQADGPLLRTFDELSRAIYCVAITPDGKHAVSGADDNLLKLWDLSSGKLIRTFKGHSRSPACLVVTADGKQVISGSSDHTLKVWEIANGKLVRTLTGHSNTINCLALSPDGKHVASGGDDKKIKLWDIASGKIIRTISNKANLPVKCVAITPDQKLILSGSYSQLILSHYGSGKQKNILTGDSEFNSFQIMPDGEHIITTGRSPRIWNLKSGLPVQTLEGNTILNRIALSSDGERIIGGDNNGALIVWDRVSGKQVQTLSGHFEAIKCLAISPDGKHAISGSVDRTLKLWDLESRNQNKMPRMHSHQVNNVVVSQSGERVVSGSVSELKVWDPADGTLSQELKQNSRHHFSTDYGRRNWISFLPDEQYLISQSHSKMLGWDLNTGSMIQEFNPETQFNIVAVTPDGTRCIIYSRNQRTNKYEHVIWDLTSREPILNLKGHENGLNCLEVSADGKQLFSGGVNELKVWDLASGKLLHTYDKQIGYFKALALSGDGKYAITCTLNEVYVWDLANQKLLHSLKGHQQRISCLAISPDSKQAVSWSYDKTLKLWDLVNGKLLATSILDDVAGHIAFSTDNRTLFVGCQSGYVHKLLIQLPGKAKNTQPGPTLIAQDAGVKQQSENAKKLKKEIYITNSMGMEFALIPAGAFPMGSGKSATEIANRFDTNVDDHRDEHPQHQVQISKSFYMGRYEVTSGQFQKFVKMTGYKTEPERKRTGGFGWNDSTETFVSRLPQYNWKETGWTTSHFHPVMNVTWNDAVNFCTWLSRQEGVKYRLPTEAEWEYACRAGTSSLYYTGNDPEGLSEVGNIWDRTAREKFKANYSELTGIETQDGFAFTSPVGNYRSNSWGLYDMHGNVFEWCSDLYSANYYKELAGKPSIDPKGPELGKDRVVRGGSWYLFPEYARAAYRSRLAPEICGENVGFRVVRELD